MNELNQELIEKAIKLCGKSIGEMNEIIGDDGCSYEYEFSYPKFFYYLLSNEFIDRYIQTIRFKYGDMVFPMQYKITANMFGQAIYEYQSGNPEPIEKLLSKI